MSLAGKLAGVFTGGKEEEDPFDYEGEIKFDISTDMEVKITSKTEKLSDVDVKYPLIKPFAYAHVKWDPEQKEIVYHLQEPELEERDEETLELIRENLSEKLDVSLDAIKSRENTIKYLQKKIDELLTELGISLEEERHSKLMYFIYRDYVGLGKIEPFMHDPYIEDLGADGTGVPIFAVHSEFGSVKTTVKFDEEEKLKNLVVKLAERCGKYVSYANPLLDGALPDGSRVNASLTSDVTAHGPTFSIRKFQETPFSAINMMDLGTVSAELMAYMWIVEEYQQSYLICGGTSTGKTSLLNSTVSFIPPEDKIVSIEDTRELQLPHENWIPSVTRSMFGTSDSSDVDMNKLLEESFRENPDYVIVGEVRGEEASVLFQGMASGHPSIGTMHASGPNDVVKRLVTPPINLSPALVESLDVIVSMTHAKGVNKSARRVRAVHEIQKVMGDSQSARTNELFTWTARDDSFRRRGEPYLFDEISNSYGVSKEELKKELEQRTQILNWLQDKGVNGFDIVAEIISEYYKDREAVLKMADSENPEYTLDDVIEAEEKVNLSRPKRLDKEYTNTGTEELKEDFSRKERKLTEEIQDLDGDQTVEEKKKKDPNPVAELEKRLRAEKEKVDRTSGTTADQREEENPFEEEEEGVEANPFE